jgi:hypothetical protein
MRLPSQDMKHWTAATARSPSTAPLIYRLFVDKRNRNIKNHAQKFTLRRSQNATLVCIATRISYTDADSA